MLQGSAERANPPVGVPDSFAEVSDDVNGSFSEVNLSAPEGDEEIEPAAEAHAGGEAPSERGDHASRGAESESSSSSSSSDETESEFGDDGWTRGEGFKCPAARETEAWTPEVSMYRHKKSLTIHHLSAGSTSEIFVCGRKVSQDYELIETSAFRDLRTCKQCAAGKPLRDTGSLIRALEARAKH